MNIQIFQPSFFLFSILGIILLILIFTDTRIMEFLRQVISSETARPTQIPPGLSLFRAEIATMAGQLARLVSHNRAVFAQHYADLIQKHCID